MAPNSHWQNKVVAVTGGSQGLGREIARVFAAAGARVVLVARGAEALTAAAEAITSATGSEVVALPADITNDAQVDELFRQIRERFGRLHVLVNNAGRSARKEILATTPSDFQELMELNLYATVRCTRAAAPMLLESGGSVVNIGSLAAKSAARYLGAYPASKFAVAAYSQQLRLELGSRGLHVLLVCPGPIARDEVRTYGADERGDLPESAAKPGGGVQAKAIAPAVLAAKIVRACEQRKLELILPGKARILFLLQALSARWGDWLVKKKTGG